MRKRNILLAALVLMAVFTAVTAKEQLNRNVLLLKNGRIIPVLLMIFLLLYLVLGF